LYDSWSDQPSNTEHTEWAFGRNRVDIGTGDGGGADPDSRRAEADELLGTVGDVWEHRGDLEWGVQRVVRGTVEIAGGNG
jgi:hypothetical protein